jgi:hypothetical protein
MFAYPSRSAVQECTWIRVGDEVAFETVLPAWGVVMTVSNDLLLAFPGAFLNSRGNQGSWESGLGLGICAASLRMRDH